MALSPTEVHRLYDSLDRKSEVVQALMSSRCLNKGPFIELMKGLFGSELLAKRLYDAFNINNRAILSADNWVMGVLALLPQIKALIGNGTSHAREWWRWRNQVLFGTFSSTTAHNTLDREFSLGYCSHLPECMALRILLAELKQPTLDTSHPYFFAHLGPLFTEANVLLLPHNRTVVAAIDKAQVLAIRSEQARDAAPTAHLGYLPTSARPPTDLPPHPPLSFPGNTNSMSGTTVSPSFTKNISPTGPADQFHASQVPRSSSVPGLITPHAATNSAAVDRQHSSGATAAGSAAITRLNPNYSGTHPTATATAASALLNAVGANPPPNAWGVSDRGTGDTHLHRQDHHHHHHQPAGSGASVAAGGHGDAGPYRDVDSGQARVITSLDTGRRSTSGNSGELLGADGLGVGAGAGSSDVAAHRAATGSGGGGGSGGGPAMGWSGSRNPSGTSTGNGAAPLASDRVGRSTDVVEDPRVGHRNNSSGLAGAASGGRVMGANYSFGGRDQTSQDWQDVTVGSNMRLAAGAASAITAAANAASYAAATAAGSGSGASPDIAGGQWNDNRDRERERSRASRFIDDDASLSTAGRAGTNNYTSGIGEDHHAFDRDGRLASARIGLTGCTRKSAETDHIWLDACTAAARNRGGDVAFYLNTRGDYQRALTAAESYELAHNHMQLPAGATLIDIAERFEASAVLDEIRRYLNRSMCQRSCCAPFLKRVCTSCTTHNNRDAYACSVCHRSLFAPRAQVVLDPLDEAFVNACIAARRGDAVAVAAFVQAGGDPSRLLFPPALHVARFRDLRGHYSETDNLVEIACRARNEFLLDTLSSSRPTASAPAALPMIQPYHADDETAMLLLTEVVSGLARMDPSGLVAVNSPLFHDTFVLPQPTADGWQRRVFDLHVESALTEAGAINFLPNTEHPLHSLWNGSTGDCLLDAAMQALVGVPVSPFPELLGGLREALSDNLSVFKDALMPRFQVLRSAETAAIGLVLTPDQWDHEWLTIVQNALVPRKQLEQIHILVLACMLRRPIVVFGVARFTNHLGEELQDAAFAGVYLPLLLAPELCERMPIVISYTRGHFTALVTCQEQCETREALEQPQHTVPLQLWDNVRDQVLPLALALSTEDEPMRVIQQYMDVVEHRSRPAVILDVRRRSPLVVEMLQKWLQCLS